jgi:antibiotic biosynthesis monooxygenase (ABM) superfamily enzyme
MIRHVVFFKFKPLATGPSRRAFIKSLSDLPAKIPYMMNTQVGTSKVGTDDYDLVLICDFENLQKLKAFATDPNHQPVLAQEKVVIINGQKGKVTVNFEVS